MVSLCFISKTMLSMSIEVKFFASLREKTGIAETTLEHAQTAADAWHQATGGMPRPEKVLVAINLEYADFDAKIMAGDEVAFFPPVTGG